MSKTVPFLIVLASAFVLLCLVPGSASADGNNNSSTADPVLEGLNGPFDIDPAGDLDWYWFFVPDMAFVHLETNGSSGDGVMYLYDQNESLIEYDDDGGVGLWSRIDRVLPPGNYYVVIGRLGNSGTIFGYYLTLNVDTGYPLAQGPNGPFNITPAGDIDLFSFNTTSTSIVRLELNGTSGDPVMYLYDANFTQLAYDDDGGVGLWSRIVRTLPAGQYYARVQALSSGSTIPLYYITLEVDAGTPLNEGLNGPFDISPVLDSDVFTFDVFEPSRVRVELDGPSGSTLLTLFDQNGSFLTRDYTSGNGSFSRIIQSLYPGFYYVTVEERYGTSEIFNYTVTLERVSLAGPDGNGIRENATEVFVGTNGPFDIDPMGDLDWYVITFPVSGIAVIETQGQTGDTVMTLYSGMGGWLAQDYDSGAGSFSHIEANVTNATYFILVQGRTSSYTIYNYTLDIAVAPLPGPDGNDAPADALPISVGTTDGFSLVGTDVDWYRYTTTVPGTLTAETNGIFGGTYVTLYESDGVTLVASGTYTGNNSFQEVTALVDVGTYLVRVQLYNYGVAAILDYNVTITFVEWVSLDGNDFRSEAVPLAQGLNGPYSIEPAADVDWFWFEQTEAGQSTVLILGGNGRASVALLNETGVLLSGGNNGNQQASRSLQPGIYYVRLQSAYGYYTVDSYYLNLTYPDHAPPVINIAGPANQTQVDTGATTITGTTEAGARVWVNGVEVFVQPDGSFSTVVTLSVGVNTFAIVSRDPVMNEAQANLTVIGVDPYQSLTNQLNQANQDLASAQQELSDAQAAEASTSAELAEANTQIASQKEALDAANQQADAARVDADAQRGLVTGAMALAIAGIAGGVAVAFLIGRRRPPTEPSSSPPVEAPAASAPATASPASDMSAVPLPSPTVVEQPREPVQ